ncbi:polysaccharide deacetylase family protein [Ruminococcaceae bacterium OttesenSCG-928-L11]|nr:polysaccharide deacetylase family protein [Ruminococcaceae bacterium OttesenSCG-928-L11]
MKLKRAFAVALAALVVTATGCTTRNNNNSSSSNGVVSSIEEGAADLRSDVEDGLSRVEEGASDLADDLFGSEDADRSAAPEEDLSSPTDGSDIDDTLSGTEDFDEESAAAAMSTDFEQIGALDAEKKGWGPGLNTDSSNRPLGSIDYQQKYGKYGAYFIAPNAPKVYLTFDEGYENGMTADILDTLKEKNVKAVFFITYPYAVAEPELVKRMVDEGHILGNHSTKHLSFPEMTLEDAAADITRLHDYVRANFGYTMTLFRPPMGEFSEQVLALTQSMGYSSVFWSFAYKDWEVENQPLTIEALNTVTSRCHPGAIYLLHAVSQTNAEILPEAIDAIRAKGYEFARFDWA